MGFFVTYPIKDNMVEVNYYFVNMYIDYRTKYLCFWVKKSKDIYGIWNDLNHLFSSGKNKQDEIAYEISLV